MQVVLARTATSGRWVPLEARDRPGYSDESVGCLVLVDGTAWRPADLIEHFMARFEISEPQARDLVADYPFHRFHEHDPADRTYTEETTAHG